MRKILFVCTANVCRSPMAEAILNTLAEDGSLPLQAESAGVAALVGRGIAPNAVATLAEAGIYTGDHQARQVDRTMVDDADLVLTMGPWHVAELGRIIGEVPGKVHNLLAYAVGAPHGEEVPDPYGYTMVAYRASMRQLLECVESLIERLDGQ